MNMMIARKKGVPLTGAVLEDMSEEERAFWQGFLQAVQTFRQESGETTPLPESLLEQYQIAISKYDGLQYCQVRQIQELYGL
jgi:hypothetical protein